MKPTALDPRSGESMASRGRGPQVVPRRRAYAMLVTVAVIMGSLAIICSLALGYPLRDPDGFRFAISSPRQA